MFESNIKRVMLNIEQILSRELEPEPKGVQKPEAELANIRPAPQHWLQSYDSFNKSLQGQLIL